MSQASLAECSNTTEYADVYDCLQFNPHAAGHDGVPLGSADNTVLTAGQVTWPHLLSEHPAIFWAQVLLRCLPACSLW